MNILWRFRTHNALYNQVKELKSALEHMEEELNLQIEKLQDENEYLKDELSYSRVRSIRLDEEIKDRRSAERFLDSFEAVLGDQVRRGSDAMSRQQLIYGVKCAETARGYISRNIRPVLVIREMILKLEEYR